MYIYIYMYIYMYICAHTLTHIYIGPFVKTNHSRMATYNKETHQHVYIHRKHHSRGD